MRTLGFGIHGFVADEAFHLTGQCEEDSGNFIQAMCETCLEALGAMMAARQLQGQKCGGPLRITAIVVFDAECVDVNDEAIKWDITVNKEGLQ